MYFVTASRDLQIRVFTFLTGKLFKVYDESLGEYDKAQKVWLGGHVVLMFEFYFVFHQIK